MVKFRNTNFINSQMSVKDITLTFEYGKIGIKDFIYHTLIEEGYLKKKARYFIPTEKLLDLAYVPEKLTLDEDQRRCLSVVSSFYKKEIIELLDGNKQVFKTMVKMGLLKQEPGRRYRKSEKFEEMLSDGMSTITLKGEK